MIMMDMHHVEDKEDSNDDVGASFNSCGSRVQVDLSTIETEKYMDTSPSVHIDHIMKLLCRKSDDTLSSPVFCYSKLYQQTPLPFIAIHASHQRSRQDCLQDVLPTPLSEFELERISSTHLEGRSHADAEKLTGNQSHGISLPGL